MFTRSTRKVENDPVSTPETDPASVSSRLNYPPPLSSLPQITNDIPRTRLQKRHFLPPPHHPPLFLSRSLCFISEFHPRESIPSFSSHFPDQDPIRTKDSINPAAELRRNDYPGTEWPLERKHTRRENFNLLLLIGGN